MATASRSASSAPISSKSSARSGSRSQRSRPPSPPCMFVVDSWSIPAPKVPKPLPRLEKKPKRPSTSPSQSIFPSFGKKKSFSNNKGKSKESMSMEPTSASTESWSDTGSIPLPASSRTSLTSYNSSSRSTPSSPKKQAGAVAERLLESLAPPSASAAIADARQRKGVVPSSSTQTIGAAGSASSFRRHLKQRSSASDLSHQSQGSRKKELSFLHRRASVNVLHRAHSNSSKETNQSGSTFVTPSSASSTPFHLSSALLNFESADENGEPASQLSLERYDTQLLSSSPSGSGQFHDPPRGLSGFSSLNPVRYSPSQESLMLDVDEEPMIFASSSSSSTPYSPFTSSYGPTLSEPAPAPIASPPRSRSASTSRQFDTVQSEIAPFSTSGQSATSSPSTVRDNGARRGHKASHSIATRPTSPFDNLIPPASSVIHSKIKMVPIAPAYMSKQEKLLGFSRLDSGTTRQHSQQGWMGEWNRNDMTDVIQSLRNLK